MLRPSVVCNVCTCIVAKRRVLPKNCVKKQIGDGRWGIKWPRDRWRHVTLKRQGYDPKVHNTFRAQYLENSWRCSRKQSIRILCCGVVWSAILATARLHLPAMLCVIKRNLFAGERCRSVCLSLCSSVRPSGIVSKRHYDNNSLCKNLS